MSFNARTSLADARNAYVENADYVELSSSAKCKAFITAARRLLVLMPAEVGTRSANTRMQVDEIAKQIAAAESWLGANGATSGGAGATTDNSITYADFRNIRS